MELDGNFQARRSSSQCYSVWASTIFKVASSRNFHASSSSKACNFALSSLEKPLDFTIEKGTIVFLDTHAFRSLEEDQFSVNVTFAFVQGQVEVLVHSELN